MDFVLNPEAPEFYPKITSLTKETNMLIYKTVKCSNTYPTKFNYESLKSSPDFKSVTSVFSECVIKQENLILNNEFTGMKMKPKDVKSNMENFSKAYDCILDRAALNIDAVIEGETVSDTKALQGGSMIQESSVQNVSDALNRHGIPQSRYREMGPKKLPETYPRPQLNFKDPIDNSKSLWVPKITNKPNSIKPLALRMLYSANGEECGYENPYKEELEAYIPPQEFLKADPTPPCFPPPLENTKFTYIDTEHDVDQLVEHLNTVKEIAIDLEHHSYRSYQGFTCLIQISTDEGGDFIIDAVAVREHLGKLNLSFTDPNKVKVLHGADNDVLWLQRDFGVYIVGLFDTYRAALALKLYNLSLKTLLFKYCNVNIDKKYQLADWRERPLPAEYIHYARLDTHYLLYVWRCMKAELLDMVGGEENIISVFSRSKDVCATTYRKPVVTDSVLKDFLMNARIQPDIRKMTALKLLYNHRDEEARRLDESTSFLMPNRVLVKLIKAFPREIQGVISSCFPATTFCASNYQYIHKVLLACHELPVEALTYAPRSTPPESGDVSSFSEQKNVVVTPENETASQCKPQVSIMFSDIHERKRDVPLILGPLALSPHYVHQRNQCLMRKQELSQLADREARVLEIAKEIPVILDEVYSKLLDARKFLEHEISRFEQDLCNNSSQTAVDTPNLLIDTPKPLKDTPNPLKDTPNPLKDTPKPLKDTPNPLKRKLCPTKAELDNETNAQQYGSSSSSSVQNAADVTDGPGKDKREDFIRIHIPNNYDMSDDDDDYDCVDYELLSLRRPRYH